MDAIVIKAQMLFEISKKHDLSKLKDEAFKQMKTKKPGTPEHKVLAAAYEIFDVLK